MRAVEEEPRSPDPAGPSLPPLTLRLTEVGVVADTVLLPEEIWAPVDRPPEPLSAIARGAITERRLNRQGELELRARGLLPESVTVGIYGRLEVQAARLEAGTTPFGTLSLSLEVRLLGSPTPHLLEALPAALQRAQPRVTCPQGELPLTDWLRRAAFLFLEHDPWFEPVQSFHEVHLLTNLTGATPDVGALLAPITAGPWWHPSRDTVSSAFVAAASVITAAAPTRGVVAELAQLRMLAVTHAVLLALHQAAALQGLSRRLSHEIVLETSSAALEALDRSRVDYLALLQAGMFGVASADPLVQELYDRVRSNLRVVTLNDEVRSEIELVESYVRLRAQQQQLERDARFQRTIELIALVFALVTFLAAILALDGVRLVLAGAAGGLGSLVILAFVVRNHQLDVGGHGGGDDVPTGGRRGR